MPTPTAAPCDYCTGSHYLQDVKILGPCFCCTPEAMQVQDAALAHLGILAKGDAAQIIRLTGERNDKQAEFDEAVATMSCIADALAHYLLERGSSAQALATGNAHLDIIVGHPGAYGL